MYISLGQMRRQIAAGLAQGKAGKDLKQLVRVAIHAVQGERSSAGAVELRLPFPSFCGRSLTRTWFGHRHPRLDGATWKAAGPCKTCKGQKQTLASHGRVPAQTAFQKIQRLGVFLSCLQVWNWAAFNQLTIAFVWLFACLMVLRRWV